MIEYFTVLGHQMIAVGAAWWPLLLIALVVGIAIGARS